MSEVGYQVQKGVFRCKTPLAVKAKQHDEIASVERKFSQQQTNTVLTKENKNFNKN